MFESNAKTSQRRKAKTMQRPERTKLQNRRLFLESLEDRALMATVALSSGISAAWVTNLQAAGHTVTQLSTAQVSSGALTAGNFDVYIAGRIMGDFFTPDITASYVSGVNNYLNAGGSLVTEWDGYALAFTSWATGPGQLRVGLDTTQPLGGYFAGSVGGYDSMSPQPVITNVLAHPIWAGLPAATTFSNVEYPATTYNFDPAQFDIVATYQGDGSVMFPNQTFPAIIVGKSHAIVGIAFDWQDDPASIPLRTLVNNTVAFAATYVPSTTTVQLNAGNLVVTDISSTGKADSVTVNKVNIAGVDRIRIHDPNNSLIAGVGTIQVDANTVDTIAASITGSVIVNGQGGADTTTVDLSVALGKVVTFNGGNPTTNPGDKLIVTGGTHATATLNHTNSNDGNVVLGANTINYTGLEPVDITGTTITNLVINLPDTDDATDDDTKLSVSVGNLIVDSQNGEHEDDSISLTGITSITINGREGSDKITLDKSLNTFAGTIAVNGGNDGDTLVLDLSGGAFAAAIMYTGGSGNDKLTYSGAGAVATATLGFPNTLDISFSLGLSNVTPIGVEHVNVTGTTIANLIVNLPDTDDADDDDSNFSQVAGVLVIDSQNSEHQDAEIDLTGVTAITINGRAGDDEITLDDTLESFAGAGGITVNGGDQNDTILVDLTSGTFDKTVNVNGNAQTGAPGDKLAITGGTHTLVTVNHLNANDGDVTIDGAVINYTGLEPVDITGSTITDLVVNLPDATGDDTELSVVAGTLLKVDSLTGTHEDDLIVLPTGSITVNGRGGADILRLDSTLSAFGGALIITGGLGADELDVTALAESDIDLAAESGTGFNGTATGTITYSFETFEEINAKASAGATLDSLTGLNEISTWTVDDVAGNKYKFNNELSFSGFDALIGESKADTYNVLDTSATTKYTITGKLGDDNLNFSAYKVAAVDKSVDVALTGAAADGFDGTVKAAGGATVFVDFTDIDNITGNTTATLDTITGLDAVATWTVNDGAGSTYAAPAVTANTLAFSKFENLTGNAKADTYNVEGTSATAKYTIAAKGGADSLNFSAYKIAAVDKSVDVALTAAAADGFDGAVKVAGGAMVFVDFSDIDSVTGNASATLDSLTGLDAVANWTVNDVAGSTYAVPAVTANTLAFSKFENLNGNAKADTYNVQETSATAKYTITAKDGSDSLSFSAYKVAAVNKSVDVALAAGAADGFDGTVKVAGGATVFVDFSDVDSITGNATATLDSLTGLDAVANWSVNDAAGSTYAAPAVTANTLAFSKFENLTGNTKADTFNVEETSATTKYTITAKDGSDTLSFSAYKVAGVNKSVDTALTAGAADGFDGTVKVAGSATVFVDFSDVDSITGNATATLDSLTGLDAISTWTVNDAAGSTYAAPAVTANTLAFSKFESLTGNAKADTYNVEDTSATAKYTITAKDGVDNLNFSAYKVAAVDKSVDVALTAAATDGFDGTVKVAGGATVIVDFSDVDNVTGNTTATLDSITGLNEVATWTVNDGAGSTYAVPAVTANTLAFSKFENLTGNAKVDTFNVEDTSATAKYTIAAKDGIDNLSFSAYKVAAVNKSVDVALAAGAADGFDGTVKVAGGATVFVDFSDVDNVTGNATTTDDSLTGVTAVATWTINDAAGSTYSAPAVTANTLAYSKFENLTGNTKVDTYNVEDTSATLKYTIAAKDGIDNLSFSAYKVAAVNKSVDTALTAAAADGFDGTVKVAGGATVFVDFSDVDNVTGNTTATLDSLTGLNEVATWTVNDGAGSNYAVSAVTPNTLGFNRYENLTGNTKADTYEMLDTSSTVKYTIAAKTGVDNLNFTGYKVAAVDKSVDATLLAAAADGYDGTVKVAGSATVFVDFSDLDNFKGNSTAALDSLTGINADSTWTINEAVGSTYVAPSITANTAGYAKFETLNGEASKDTYKVQNNVGQAYALNGKGNSDTFLVGDTVNSLASLISLKIDGGTDDGIGAADTDELSLLDTAQAGAKTYVIRPTGITFEAQTLAPTNGANFNVEMMKLNASAGANTVKVRDGNYGDVVGLANTKEADLMLIHAANGNKSALEIEDMADTVGNTWTINATKTTRSAPDMAFRIDYTSTSLSSTLFDAGQGGDTIDMEATASPYTLNGHQGRETLNIKANNHATNVNSQEDNDTINVANGNLNNLLGTLMVDGGDNEAGTRTVASGGTRDGNSFKPTKDSTVQVGDTLNVMDNAQGGATNYVITNTTITRAGAPNAVGYKLIDQAMTKGGTGNSDIRVEIPPVSSTTQLPPVIMLDDADGKMDNRVYIKGNADLNTITTGNSLPVPNEGDRSQFELSSTITRMWIQGGKGKNVIHNRSSVPALIDGNGENTSNKSGGAAQDNLISSDATSSKMFSPVSLGNDGKDFLHTKNNGADGTTYLVGDYFINSKGRLQVIKDAKDNRSGEIGDSYYNEPGLVGKNSVLARRDITVNSVGPGFANVTVDSLGKNLNVISWLQGKLNISVGNAQIANKIAEINYHIRNFQKAPGEIIPPIGSAVYRPGGVAGGNNIDGGEFTDGEDNDASTVTTMTNPFDAADVNMDGKITAFDALAVVNELNLGGARVIDTSEYDISVVTAGGTPKELALLDVNGDRRVSAMDALAIINRLNLDQTELATPDFFGDSDLLESDLALNLVDELILAGHPADSLTDEALLALLAQYSDDSE